MCGSQEFRMRGLAQKCTHGAPRQVYLRTLVPLRSFGPLVKHDIYSIPNMSIFFEELCYITITNTYLSTNEQNMHVRQKHS